MPPKVQDRVVQQAYRFALAPTDRQIQALNSHAGASRYAYNWGLATVAAALDARAAEKETTGTAVTEVPKHFALCKQWTAYKDAHAGDPDPAEGERRTNTAWVAENSICVYQAALRDAAAAWQAFFDSKAGRRKGRRVGRPKFKKRGRARDSFQVHGDGLRLADATHINLPKIGRVKVCESMRKVTRRLGKGTVPCPECDQTGFEPAPAASKGKTVRACPVCQGTAGSAAAAGSRSGMAEAGGGQPAGTAGRGTAGMQAGQGMGTAAPASSQGTTGSSDTAGTTGTTCSGTGCGGTGKVKPCHACNGALHVPVLRIIRGTVARGSDRRWTVSLTVETVRQIRLLPTARQQAGGVIGVDFGTRELATLSTGEVIDNPRFLAGALRRLQRAQQALSRCEKDSARRADAVTRVGRLHARVRHLREDNLQKITTRLVQTHAVIGMEGFNVQAVAERGSKDLPRKVRARRNRDLADASPGMTRWMITHKGAWDGVRVVVADRHEQTGRTCSRCGQVRATPVPPGRDMFDCGHCGYRGNRRENTARLLALRACSENGSTSAPSSEDDVKHARRDGVSRVTVRRRLQPSLKREASRRSSNGRPGTPGS